MTTPAKVRVLVEKIIEDAEGVKTFMMLPQKKCPIFKPGQFLHLAMDPYDPSFNWPESRVFSIANSPTRRDRLKIIFSVKGTFTRRMFDEVKEGDEVYIKLPYGSFTFPVDDHPVILVAGGTGITRFLSYLEYAIDRQLGNEIHLHYGIRSAKLALGSLLLAECREKLPGFTCTYYTEDGSWLDDVYENCLTGIIDINNVTKDVSDRTVYYLSGPPEMIITFKNNLLSQGIRQDFIVIDNWG